MSLNTEIIAESQQTHPLQNQREFTLPDGTLVSVELYPVGVDRVRLGVFLSHVPEGLWNLCQPRECSVKRSSDRVFCGSGERDGIWFYIRRVPGQQNRNGMYLSVSFNPNTLNHTDARTGEVCVWGDNTFAYNPSLLGNGLLRVKQCFQELDIPHDAFELSVNAVDITRDIVFLHPASAILSHEVGVPL